MQGYQKTGEQPTFKTYTAGAKGFEIDDPYQLPFVVSFDGKVVAGYRFAKFSGGTGPDLLFQSFENHTHMVAIYAVWYNWVRIHKTLRVTPAMAAGLSETVMDWTDIVEAMDADAPTAKRGPYKKTGEEISNW
jgi:hypothetical protein